MSSASQQKGEERRQANLQSIYARAGRVCTNKGQAHLRDFAEVDDSLKGDPEEKNAWSDVQEAA